MLGLFFVCLYLILIISLLYLIQSEIVVWIWLFGLLVFLSVIPQSEKWDFF